MPIAARELRNCLGRFATGVTVVTASHEQRDHGMTANAFTSVSLDPPLVLVAVRNEGRIKPLLEGSGRFAVSVLAEDQEALALHFSGRTQPGLSDEQLLALYRLMRRVRALDQEAVNLQRQGELTAYAPLSGQEACQVGSAYALAPGDFAFPSYRELGVAVTRGVDVGAYLLAYRGIWHGGMHDPLAQNVAPFASPVGSHLLHAVGWAMGRRKDSAGDCAIVYFGEGATSEGDALE